ncbi:arsenate reductase family protein [Jannaschia rubra]|uniref:arsenate reductase family protein n=1 Tax=Jannaschia rubra TaxID=282197 RepID=UPI0031E9F5E2
MITLHGLRACDTCRRALRALKGAGHDVRLRDLRDDPPDRAGIARWQATLGPALLNTRSTTWRGLDADERRADPVTLMAAHPTLMKRPVVEMSDGTLHLGWTPATRATLGL